MHVVGKRIISTAEDAKNICNRIKRLDESVADFSEVKHVSSSAAKKILELCDEFDIKIVNADRDTINQFNELSEES